MNQYNPRGSILMVDPCGVVPSDVAGESVTIPAGNAGDIVNFYTAKKPVLDANKSWIGGNVDTSLALTSTTFDTEVALETPDSELENGEYWFDHLIGKGRGKKSDNAVSMTVGYSIFLKVGSSGDVLGPASSTDNAIARFNGTTGKLIQNSGVIIDDSDNITGINNLSIAGSFTLPSINLTANSNQIILDSDDGGGATTTITDSATVARVITLPDATDTLVGLATSDTLTNKSIDADSNIITNIGFAEFDTDVSDTMKFTSGAYLDKPVVTVASDGATITLSVEKDGGGDIRVLFQAAVYTWDTTPADTVSLTAGTDTDPVLNYIYLLESTKVLTSNTSGFPATEHAPIATVLCQSAASLQTDGAYKVHSWTDHMFDSTDNGHLHHLNSWIRKQHATHDSGVATTPTITINGGAEDNVDIATSAGVINQLHTHTYPAFNTSTGSEVYIVNKSGAAYTKITDLNAADEDNAGNAITTNKWTNLVIWGVVSEATGDCKLYVNLPSGFHGSAGAATADSAKFSNYNIPSDFIGTGFLIARLTLKYTAVASGTWTLEENLDLRKTLPSIFAGGTAATTTEFTDSTFKILDNDDATKVLQFQLSGLTTATTRTLTIPDLDGTIMLNLIEDTTPELGGELDAGANSIGFTLQTATGDGTTTIDWKLGNKFNFTFGAFNETFTFTAPTNPGNFILKLKQDATGSRTATWPASVKWPSGTAPTLTTDANANDIISFYYDGTDYWGVATLDLY